MSLHVSWQECRLKFTGNAFEISWCFDTAEIYDPYEIERGLKLKTVKNFRNVFEEYESRRRERERDERFEFNDYAVKLKNSRRGKLTV